MRSTAGSWSYIRAGARHRAPESLAPELFCFLLACCSSFLRAYSAACLLRRTMISGGLADPYACGLSAAYKARSRSASCTGLGRTKRAGPSKSALSSAS